MNNRKPGFFSRFRGDRRGVSAVEFAMLAPLMITFYFGMAEFCQGFMAQKRLDHTASAVADLVAQTTVVTKDEVDDIFAIGALIMKPFPSTTLTMRVSSVTRNTSGVAKVNWSRGSGMTARAVASTVTVPTGMIDNGESVVMAESAYAYSSPVKYVMPAITNFNGTFYLRPRRTDNVTCSNC